MLRRSALLLFIVIAGCRSTPMETAPTSNPNIKAEKLFDHDGCSVYRFYDGGTIYFTKCGNGASVSWREYYQCGKSQCSRFRLVASNNGSQLKRRTHGGSQSTT